LTLCSAAAGVLVSLASAATGTLDLHADLRMTSGVGVGECPPVPPPTICHPRKGEGLVAGLGHVIERYSYDTLSPVECGGGAKVLGYPAVFEVVGKGEIDFAVAEVPGCLAEAVALTPIQTFVITGGTGLYAGAAGSGRIERSAHFTETGAAGVDMWIGTLFVPGLEFDVTPPTISGAANKVVRAPRKAKRARVTFQVTAQDDVDGARPVTCTPKSGTRFKVGRTRVSCSATDTSGNQTTATFTVKVKRRGR
jgi:hypothetical protein